MLSDIEAFYDKQPEPNKSCMLYLRNCILQVHPEITQEWKYKLPFFYFKGKMFCYLWIDKKTKHPYIGITKGKYIEHKKLVQGNRKLMKVLPVNPNKSIPVKTIHEILNKAIELY